ncbi:MAG: hypothetical protein JWP35_421 [Caulobacter sp.]|nr:hypothetical protein [Caulobacter sp.]
MTPAVLSGIAQFLAVIACCFGGGLGGYMLARPDEALAAIGLTPHPDSRQGVTEARAFGGLLLLGHGGVAAALGYTPSIGAVMALTLSLIWLGAAAGRILAMVANRSRPATEADADAAVPPVPSPAAPLSAAHRGLLSLSLLMAGCLALPFWMLLAPTLRHSGVHV